MCDGGAVSGPTIAAYASAAAAVAGGALTYKASADNQNALAQTELAENQRQGKIMQSNMALQNQQRADAQNSRDKFQAETLPAFTRPTIEADQAVEASRLQSALAQAGQRAAPSTGDASARSTTVATSGGSPSAPQSSPSYQAALENQLGYVNEFGAQQGRAQAAMAALTRAQQLGGERLQTAGQNITLSNARNAALNRAITANGLYSNASTGLYRSAADKAADKGAGMALAGSSLSTLGNIGYGYSSGGGRDANAGRAKIV